VLTLYGQINLIESFYSLIIEISSSFSVSSFESSVTAFVLSNIIDVKMWPCCYLRRPDRENPKTISRLVRNFEMTAVKAATQYCDSFA
jgi:hypothetical protein